ncbi:MAG: hypothetical protein ACOY9Y_08415 [Bacillota bacterium]
MSTGIREISQSASITAEATEHVVQSINQVSAGNQELADKSANISAAVAETAAQMEALTQNIEAIAQCVVGAATLTARGEQTMHLLDEKIKRASTQSRLVEKAMEALTAQAQQISACTQEGAASTEEIAASTAEMSLAAHTISANAQELIKMMERLTKESSKFTL